MAKEAIKVKMELPPFLPHGWKTEVAHRIGVHPKSMCRILRAKSGVNYAKAVEAAKNLYGTPINK